MIKVRAGMFETNSSSTHAICIHKQEELKFPPYIYFGLMDLGDSDCWCGIQNRANYLHTIMYEICSRTDYIALQTKITNLLKSYGIKVEWAKPKWGLDGYSPDYYDIKDSCAMVIINHIIPNDKLLLQYLFGENSRIVLGYDGVYEERIKEAKEKYPAGDEYLYYEGDYYDEYD